MRDNSLVLMGDFETTVYSGQESTEVWASAVVELYTEDVKLFHSIGDTFNYLKELHRNVTIYYHNLKFDGTFWISYLLTELHYEQAYTDVDGVIVWKDKKDMPHKSFQYSISDKGQWYTILIRIGKNYIEIRDSLKLLPFSVKKIGKSFGTKHKKLDMEYEGYRYAGCTITDEEATYIKNDVLVVKEALEILFDEGHNKLTIGSCCLSEFKKLTGSYDYKLFFPNVYDIELDEETYNSPSVGDYILKSYGGGWCYVAKGKENRIYHNGTTADVNSLYPSMMSSESGNRYPVGKPKFWVGDIPDEAKLENRYYFVRVRCRFKLKDGYLPFIHIRNSLYYNAHECLESSDVLNKQTGKRSRYYKGADNQWHDSVRTMTFTQTDWELVQEHYELYDLEILDGCWFYSEIGLFDEYMEKYKKIKQTSTGAKRELAKLFLNNLYGKMASTTNSSFKVAIENDDGTVGYGIQLEYDKDPGYIPIGSAITSYARNFTIRTAQKNYYGADKRGFIYADTDSIHCDLLPSELVDVPVDDVAFCHWKLESCWDEAIFTRQKTYIEHVTKENLKDVEPYYTVKCAGMPDQCKQLFIKSITGNYEPSEYNDKQLAFLKTKRTLQDFKLGLKIWGKLMPKRIKGGTVLVETTYEMR